MSFTSEKWLVIGSIDGSGDGSPNDPFVTNTPETFANLLRLNSSVPSNTLARLGPGIFRTRGVPGNGFDPQAPKADKIFFVKPGQRILGAGMFSTTLQLVWDFAPPDQQYVYKPGQKVSMILRPRDDIDANLAGFSLEDLTLDCNLQHLPEPFAPTINSGTTTASVSANTVNVTASGAFFSQDMVGSTFTFLNSNGTTLFEARIMSYSSSTAITISVGPTANITNAPFKIYGVRFSVTAASLFGDNVRLRRVRIINFGTTTGLYGINVSYAGDLNVESNVINNAATDKAVVYSNCTAAKFFNNETSGGTLLRGYDGTKYALELEDAVQDVLLAL